MWLSPDQKSIREKRGQVARLNLVADCLDVVGGPMQLGNPLGQFQKSPRSPGVPVPWLAHTPGVEEDAPFGLPKEGNMCVPHDEDLGSRQFEETRSGLVREHVFIRVGGAPVYKPDARAPTVRVQLDGEIGKEPLGGLIKLAPGPVDGLGRMGVEPGGVPAQGHPVVVPLNGLDPSGPKQPNDLVRERVVPHDVPGVEDVLRSCLFRRLKDHLQGGQVAMDVRD